MNLRPDADEPPRGVTVFGASDVEEGEPAYERARELGRLLAEQGVPVVSGGYGGVMEAASRGAAGAGGEAIGVTCQVFRGRTPNRFLSLEIEEPDLSARAGRLVALSRGSIVLAGSAGTLAELALLWASARAGVLPGPIVIWDEGWSELFELLCERGRLDRPAVRVTVVAQDAEDAVRRVLAEAPAESRW
jgi:hypothetical protein